MITSLNVNQFLKKGDWKKFQGKHKEKIKIWQDIEDYYYTYIREHLVDPEDLIVLHEVPYKKEEGYSSYSGEIKVTRSKSISDIYIALEKFCQNNGFEILKPSEDDAFFITVAIFKKGAYRKFSNIIEKTFTEYANRIIVLERTAEHSNEIIIGLHIPAKCEVFWNNLIAFHEKLPEDKRIIYIGDLNTYDPDTINKKKFYEFLSKGLVDVWIENGNSHTKETFEGNTRIDYVLMTGKDFCKGKYKITIDDTIRKQEYSDHSAIIMQVSGEKKNRSRYNIYFDNIHMLDLFLRHIEVNHEFDGTTTYKYNSGYLSPDRIEPVEVIFPDIDKSKSWEVLRAVSFGDFNNCPSAEVIVSQSKDWYEKYGAVVTEIRHDTIMYSLPDSLDIEKINYLKDEILSFAPNSIEFYKSEDDIVECIAKQKCFYVWWD